MTFNPEIFAQDGDTTCASGNLLPSPSWADMFRVVDADIPTERDETKPCRPIYCALHDGCDLRAECSGAYRCIENQEM